MKIQFLVENKTEHEGILAEHGLSIYIEADGQKILFDAGASDIFSMNAEAMQVDLSQVDFAVASHGHYDHTGGFPLFCRINRKAPIYIHKNAFRQSHGVTQGKIDTSMCGIRWSRQVRDELHDRLHYTEQPVRITENIAITGTIEMEEDTGFTEEFYYYNLSGKPVLDDMSHEQCLVIREKEGLYIFSGCSHRGVPAALQAAQKLFPNTPIACLAAGMHLFRASKQTRDHVFEQLAEEKVAAIMPVHCTGIETICELKRKFGKRCIIAQAGDTFDGNQPAGR